MLLVAVIVKSYYSLIHTNHEELIITEHLTEANRTIPRFLSDDPSFDKSRTFKCGLMSKSNISSVGLLLF
jgi:hypothetical protein